MEANTYSVVIPAYNAARTIIPSVESCLKQTRRPEEIIVVNDGSTDDTLDILQARFADDIRIISLPQNSGPAAARNAGIAAANCQYIAFQDADDVWHPEKLECVDTVFKNHPRIRFLFHPYTLRSIDFQVKGDMLLPEKYLMWKLLLSNPIGTPCVIMRKDKQLRFNERLRFMEDYELFLREAATHGVYQIAAPFTQLGRPILSEGGQSSRRWKMRVGEMRAWWFFARQKPLYLLVLPFLVLFALSKHIVKSFFPPRSNY
jgi:glycosyltransferase involved in cell wall biosynthesis